MRARHVHIHRPGKILRLGMWQSISKLVGIGEQPLNFIIVHNDCLKRLWKQWTHHRCQRCLSANYLAH